VVGGAAEPWRFLLRGFWTSGLRLSEACDLHWGGNVGHTIDYSRKHPMFRISGAFEKAGQDRLLPMTPEFAQLLDTVPPEDRYGPVFELVGGRGQSVTNPHRIDRTISLIGEASGIVTAHNPLTGEPRKHATAHDLRRAFGFRWSRRVMPAVLMELMRHARIETTMRFYVGENADATAEEIWSLGNNPGNNRDSAASENSQTSEIKVVRGGLEPPTPGFSVQCSTN
jgi:integrase